MKVLTVIDMQNDFISGSLGTEEARAIVSDVADYIRNFSGKIIATRDTHGEHYLDSAEGKKLPVLHCRKGSEGWQLALEVQKALDEKGGGKVIDKPAFGSVELAEYIKRIHEEEEPVEEIMVIGLCTDICVISNALLLKSFVPEVPVKVLASCCAGVTPQSHEQALNAMRMCQIEIV